MFLHSNLFSFICNQKDEVILDVMSSRMFSLTSHDQIPKMEVKIE